jgi:hypothetical protein
VLRRAVNVYERLVRRFSAQTTDYQSLLSTFAEGLYTEMDFRNEALNAQRMAQLLGARWAGAGRGAAEVVLVRCDAGCPVLSSIAATSPIAAACPSLPPLITAHSRALPLPSTPPPAHPVQRVCHC